MANVPAYVQASLPDDDDDDEEDSTEESIEWINIIFLPFHPVFKLIVFISVLFKCSLGPLQTVTPFIECSKIMDNNGILLSIKYFYLYATDSIYVIDTFLHIVHRQVTEEAMRREHMPKSAFRILLDILSIIPFYRISVSETCPKIQIWPNVLGNNEFLVIYRVVEYFSLIATHSMWSMLSGYVIITLLFLNFITCFLLLLSFEGLCAKCRDGIYDWRVVLIERFNTVENNYTTYLYASEFVLGHFIQRLVDELKPITYAELGISTFLLAIGYLALIIILVPKMFAEAVLRLRRLSVFHPNASRIINETRRRNPSPTAHVEVEKFYSLMWQKRQGLTSIPQIIKEFPRYLRTEIRQDLAWPVFHHSPTFRHTSLAFKRWLCSRIQLTYRLPGERFFAGPHCYTNLYYIQKGIVQLVSSDDSISALLSVTSGTIFGDISFHLPPLNRKAMFHCLTYCEIYVISRADILYGLHKFPEDQKLVMELVKKRIDHGRSLYLRKLHVRGKDRPQDEGIAWIKRRWWEISETVKHSRKSYAKKFTCPLKMPLENTPYHCSKFLGQLVLCNNSQLKLKSIFLRTSFPWILAPHSSFGKVWHLIVFVTVILVVFIYPPNITRLKIPKWFRIFHFYIDFIYSADIVVSLFTAIEKNHNELLNFSGVVCARLKSTLFLLDIMSVGWLEHFVEIINKPQYYYICQLNRLIKSYMLFIERYEVTWNMKKDPIIQIYYLIALTYFFFMYIFAYFFYLLKRLTPNLTYSYFFDGICSPTHVGPKCKQEPLVIAIALGWTFEHMLRVFKPHTLEDLEMGMFISLSVYFVFTFIKANFLAALYLKFKGKMDYRFFVSSIRNYYIRYEIHTGLLKRLELYLNCHWKYFNGMDIMQPNLLKSEPYDVYWKFHGEVAEKIIRESPAFYGANTGLIRELAEKAKFLILPKKSILFMFGVHGNMAINFVANGYVKCEYHDDDGVLQYTYYSNGDMLSFATVFLDKPAFRTYTAATDCEILIIKRSDFLNALKKHPAENSYIKTSLSNFRPKLNMLYEDYVQKYGDYHRNLRKHLWEKVTKHKMFYKTQKEVFQKQNVGQKADEDEDQKSAICFDKTQESVEPKTFIEILLSFYRDYRRNPESTFISIWMPFRVIICIVAITSASLQGGSGAVIRKPLTVISHTCDIVGTMDIIIKLFLPYYDSRGVAITDVKKCCKNYITHGFLMDFIGTLPWYRFIDTILSIDFPQNTELLCQTACEFSHLYLVQGYFDYLSDVPATSFPFLQIIKWQIVIMLMMLGTSHYFLSRCIDFGWDSNLNLVKMEKYNSCWIPNYYIINQTLSIKELHLMFVESLNLAQCGLTRLSLGFFKIRRDNIELLIFYVSLGAVFWYVMGYCETLLVLYYKGNTLFQHGVNKLATFLSGERVDRQLIERSFSHFRYWWMRTSGLDIQKLIGERISVVFRQDLNFFFLKTTLLAMDTILLGGETIAREIASITKQCFFQPGQEIVREMDLVPRLHIVHRGKVTIYRKGKKIAHLGKGCIFGQMIGTKLRPLKISAQAEDHADLLTITIRQFQEIISDEVRQRIAKAASNDFITLKKPVKENPYNTVKYILRGNKAIKLPWMKEPVEARENVWYFRWLLCVWVVAPILSAALVLLTNVVTRDFLSNLYKIFIALDVIQVLNFISEFYTTELVIKDNKFLQKYIRFNHFYKWTFYIDIFSLLLPLMTIVTGDWHYQLSRLLRLYFLFNYYKHFSGGFQSGYAPIMMKFVIILLLMHILTCGWITFACRGAVEDFPGDSGPITPEFNKSINYDEWRNPQKDNGCARVMKSDVKIKFMVPTHRYADYLLALNYVTVIHTHTNMDIVLPVTIVEIYYKIFLAIVLYLAEMWMYSVTVSAMYTMYRELYEYDYYVANLIKYLKDNGLALSLLRSVRKYSNMLWHRQGGNWLPEITNKAPMCLREDIFSSLYIHHMMASPLFKQLPSYFLRQLVTRLKRVVIFPGKNIVQEGDIIPCIYFIHQGEVERWCSDESGESRMDSVLFTTGYFGLVPGLFPNVPYRYTYCSRTVVDLVFLEFDDWQDLLEGYPEVKSKLYGIASKLDLFHTKTNITTQTSVQ